MPILNKLKDLMDEKSAEIKSARHASGKDGAQLRGQLGGEMSKLRRISMLPLEEQFAQLEALEKIKDRPSSGVRLADGRIVTSLNQLTIAELRAVFVRPQ